MEIGSITPFLAMAVAVGGAALVGITRAYPNLREGCSLGAGMLQFYLVLTMLPSVLAGNTIHYTLLTFLPEASISFRVDALGLVFGLTASSLWILTTIFSIGYMRHLNEHAQTRFYACFGIAMAATIGIAFSANLLTLYIFYETLTLVTYFLVTHAGTDKALAAGREYLFYHLMTSFFFLLPAIIATYTLAGTFSFQPGGVFPAGDNGAFLVIVYVLFLGGCAKAAIMPFHGWLPGAMVAPVPVSALLHAVAVVNAGVFLVFRIVLDIFGPELMQQLHLGVGTVVVGSITIVLSSFIALQRDSLKAVLAYSTISNLSYMVLGAALLNPSGLTGGIIHIANHAFAKITLFFCAGSIYLASHKTKISEMAEIGLRLPWTMAAFVIGALGIIGIPLTGGFISKWYLLVGLIEGKLFWGLAVLAIGTFLSARYFFTIIRTAYFSKAEAGGAGEHQAERSQEEIKEVSLFIVTPLIVTAVVTIILGLYPQLLLELARGAF